MMKTGRVKITGNRLSAHGQLLPIKGQELCISLVDEDGGETSLPAMSLFLECKGRKHPVEATVVLRVSDIDVDIDARLVNGVRCESCKVWFDDLLTTKCPHCGGSGED